MKYYEDGYLRKRQDKGRIGPRHLDPARPCPPHRDASDAREGPHVLIYTFGLLPAVGYWQLQEEILGVLREVDTNQTGIGVREV